VTIMPKGPEGKALRGGGGGRAAAQSSTNEPDRFDMSQPARQYDVSGPSTQEEYSPKRGRAKYDEVPDAIGEDATKQRTATADSSSSLDTAGQQADTQDELAQDSVKKHSADACDSDAPRRQCSDSSEDVGGQQLPELSLDIPLPDECF